MTTPLALAVGHRPDGTASLTVTGEIDMSNADTLAEALSSTDGPLLVDLSAVEYLDSAGLAVLFAHAEHIELIANPLVMPALTISGLVELTTVREA